VTAGEPRLTKPIFVLGFARSGTTMLGFLFHQHPDVAYWGEPRTIWMHGHAYRDHDELGAEDVTPRIQRFITSAFQRRIDEAGATRLAEKTPSNCLRLPFIHALFPDCRVLHVLRDGRAVVRSLMPEMSQPASRVRLRKRLRETPWTDLPAQLPLVGRALLRRFTRRKTASLWGPRPRGWQGWLSLPAHQRIARQWSRTMEIALRDGRALPSENYMELRYEDFVREPLEHLRRILEFTELSPCTEMEAYIRRRIDPERSARRHKPLEPRIEADIVEACRGMLQRLDYS
jgi:hypothetical protein